MYKAKIKGLTVEEQVATYGLIENVSAIDLLSTFFSSFVGKPDSLSRSTRGKSRELAEKLLNSVSVSKLVDLDYEMLQEVGVERDVALPLLSVIELVKRSKKDVDKPLKIFGSVALGKRMIDKYGHEKQEVLVATYLDAQNQIIDERVIFKGSVTRSVCSAREILHYATRNLATSIIITHNHPSGEVNPSEADKITTKKLKEACDTLDIVLLDHIIVGRNAYFSFREELDIL